MDGSLAGEVLVVEHLGGETLVHLRLPDDRTIQIKGSGDSAAADGQRITVGFGLRHVHLFNENGIALGRPVAEPATA
jgi:multiple sugar transport system ATP-binding protein